MKGESQSRADQGAQAIRGEAEEESKRDAADQPLEKREAAHSPDFCGREGVEVQVRQAAGGEKAAEGDRRGGEQNSEGRCGDLGAEDDGGRVLVKSPGGEEGDGGVQAVEGECADDDADPQAGGEAEITEVVAANLLPGAEGIDPTEDLLPERGVGNA